MIELILNLEVNTMIKFANGTPLAQPVTNLNHYRATNSNTWGFSKKIGEQTFGDYHYETYRYVPVNFGENRSPRVITKVSCTWKVTDEQRAMYRTNLRMVTKILDIAGYIPVVALIAGTIRIIAAAIIGHQIKKNILNGSFKGDLANEALRTYKAQINRGLRELIPVIGSLINLYSDLRWYRIWNNTPVYNLVEQP